MQSKETRARRRTGDHRRPLCARLRRRRRCREVRRSSPAGDQRGRNALGDHGHRETGHGHRVGVHAPTVSYYRILPGKSVEEGHAVLAGYRGIVVADGFAVYEVLARDGPGLTLAHCWAHTKRKYDEIATTGPTACRAIGALIGELYAIERLVPGSFPGDPGAQTLRAELRRDRSRPVLDQIWTWATEQAGLARSGFG